MEEKETEHTRRDQKEFLKTLAQHFGIQHDACFTYLDHAISRIQILAATVESIKAYGRGDFNDQEIGFQAEEYSMFLEDLLASMESLKKSMELNESEFKGMMEKKGIVEKDSSLFDNSHIRFDKHGGLVVLHPKKPEK